MELAYHQSNSRHQTQFVAFHNIALGTIVAAETPLLFVECPTDTRGWTDQVDAAFFATEVAGETHFIRSALEKISKPSLALFRQLPCTNKQHKNILRDIRQVQEHAIPVRVTRHEGRPIIGLAVFDGISKISHSCQPNAAFEWTGTHGEVRVTRNVRSGQSIVLDRLPGALWCSSAQERQTFLRERLSRSCGCEDCKPANVADSDTKRALVQRLHLRLGEARTMPPLEYASSFRTDAGYVDQLLGEAFQYGGLLVNMGLYDIRLAEAHYAAANILAATGRNTDAVQYATHALAIIARAYGTRSSRISWMVLEILRLHVA